MFWHTEQEEQALADWRATNREIAELNQELADFREIFWAPAFPEQKAWALQMIKSIEHELDQLQS